MAGHPTKSFEKATVDDRFRILPAGVSVAEVVDLSRCAGLAFLAGSDFGWSRVQLRQWLDLDYEAATAWTRVGDRRSPVDPTSGLDDVEVDTLIEQTRRRVVSMLEQARQLWRSPTFARDMVDCRLVVTVYDRDGAEAYAPASHGEMGLVQRVTSLFVADYLARPSDYDRGITRGALRSRTESDRRPRPSCPR